MTKETKTLSGTMGLSKNVSVVRKWEANVTYRAAISIGCIKQKYLHEDFMPSRRKKDEEDIQAVLKEMSMNPFSNRSLLSISTGITVPKHIADDIGSAKQRWLYALKIFIKKIMSEDRQLLIFDSVKEDKKIPTIDTMKKPKRRETRNKVVTIQSNKDLFSYEL